MADVRIDRTGALAFRQRATHLHRRLSAERFIDAAFAGLQDSAPRSAVLALHARTRGLGPSAWEDPKFVQVWGPRGAVYVVPREDVAVFTIGLLPRDGRKEAAIDAAAERLRKVLRSQDAQNVEVLRREPRSLLQDLRAASATGAVRIRWDGSNTKWWMVDPPDTDRESARLELARRFLRSLGPSTPEGFGWWSGGSTSDARSTFGSLGKELFEVDLAGRKSWVLQRDWSALERAAPVATIRLLPPGDPYLGAADRSLLVPHARLRRELWPKSVWPGALIVGGELVGTWRRQGGSVTVRPWGRLNSKTVQAVENEVRTMPIESAKKEVRFEPTLAALPEDG